MTRLTDTTCLLKVGETQSQQTARDIMGSNMLGILEVERYFGELTDEQRKALEIFPFSEETLKAVAKTHILVADVGLSLLDVRENSQGRLSYRLQNEEIAKRTETVRWRLIRKTSVDASLGTSWSEQERLINLEIEEIPSARQVVYTTILHFLATEERVFETCFVRCSDVASSGHHVHVGGFGWDLVIDDWYDDGRYDGVGVASSRKVLDP